MEQITGLSWCLVGAAGIMLALLEVYFVFALLAGVLFVKFIGKNLNFSAAMIALAHKRLQVSKSFKAWTM